QDKWETRVAWRCKTIFSAREPVHHGIRVARIKRTANWGFERFVMGWQRPVLQTFRHIHPAETVFVQNEWSIAPLTVETTLSLLRFVIRPLVSFEIGNVDPGPISRLPPNQFFAIAPRITTRLSAGAIINNSAVARPTEAPAMAEIISRLASICFVDTVATENAGINPATARGRSVIFQFFIAIDLRAVMQQAFAILTKNNAISAGSGFCFPTVDLREYGFHFRLALLVLWVPPIERAQRFVDRIVGGPGFSNQSPNELMNKPCIGSTHAP